ncbi:MAG: hypothetical protein GYB31_00075 [Bacteroidetes bacterium]|nr:hypothetical protein [Bacteroidota bacterium]
MRTLPILFGLFILVSCNQSNDLNPTAPFPDSNQDSNNRALIVKILYCEDAGGEICEPEPVSEATAVLYLAENAVDDPAQAVQDGISDSNGEVAFEDLDASSYYLKIQCEYGEKVLEAETPKGKTNIVSVQF